MSRVTVFCSASDKVLDKYKKLAYRLGKRLAKEGHTLIFGGGDRGLMGEVSRGVLENQGQLKGVITEHLFDKEARSQATITDCVPTMSERKELIFAHTDFVVVLPGGFGTMDEFFEAATMRQIGERQHPIYILDTPDHIFSNAVRYLINAMRDMKVIQKRDRDVVTYSDDLDELMFMIKKGVCRPYDSKFPAKVIEEE